MNKMSNNITVVCDTCHAVQWLDGTWGKSVAPVPPAERSHGKCPSCVAAYRAQLAALKATRDLPGGIPCANHEQKIKACAEWLYAHCTDLSEFEATLAQHFPPSMEAELAAALQHADECRDCAQDFGDCPKGISARALLARYNAAHPEATP